MLKPCPFCRSTNTTPIWTRVSNNVQWWNCRCDGCLGQSGCYDTEAEAIAAWNAQPEPAALVERMPTEAMWGGLARHIMMWLDMDKKTPRALFRHLEMCGADVPQWLRDEPEMQALDHVPSKGTRCVIIWKAMQDAAPPNAEKRAAYIAGQVDMRERARKAFATKWGEPITLAASTLEPKEPSE